MHPQLNLSISIFLKRSWRRAIDPLQPKRLNSRMIGSAVGALILILTGRALARMALNAGNGHGVLPFSLAYLGRLARRDALTHTAYRSRECSIACRNPSGLARAGRWNTLFSSPSSSFLLGCIWPQPHLSIQSISKIFCEVQQCLKKQ